MQDGQQCPAVRGACGRLEKRQTREQRGQACRQCLGGSPVCRRCTAPEHDLSAFVPLGQVEAALGLHLCHAHEAAVSCTSSGAELILEFCKELRKSSWSAAI